MKRAVIIALLTMGLASILSAAAVQYSINGNAAGILGTVNNFRTDIGGANNGVGGTFANGRREINWDAVGAAFRDPHPSNFFNTTSPRGVVFSHDGDRLVVSGDAGSPEEKFDNLISAYDPLTNFSTFSSPRLFGIVAGNLLTINFFIPGTSTPATVSAFGAVFTDVESASSTSISYYDSLNNLLGTFGVPSGASAELQFLGVRFNAGERIAKVVMDVGDGNFVDGSCVDCVVMDDFIYAEPEATIPEPSTFLLAAAGLVLAVMKRR